MSQQPQLRQQPLLTVAALAALLLLVVLVSLPGLRSNGIDGLDSAHHLMDGYFFHDLLLDHPYHAVGQYIFRYYKQYPALGFVFWPPLFPFVLGLFDLVLGPHVLSARLCTAFFGFVFAGGLFVILRRRFAPFLAFAAAAAAITVPGLSRSFNELMLELPTLAFMMLAILAYLHLVDHLPGRTSVPRALLCAAACAAVVYTKQPAWFLYPALLVDFAVLHRRFLRKPEVWITALATVLLCVPLALFTLKFGHADLAQSVGSNTRLIMANYQALPRWSLATWTFYPRLAPTLLNPVVLVLALAGLVLCLVRRELFRDNLLWLAWFALFYVTFSFYDNKLPRHAAFWWPAWIVLAAAALDLARRHLPPRSALAGALPVLLLLPLPFNLRHAWSQTYTDYIGERATVIPLFAAAGGPGNVLVFGPDKQMFIALLREDDPTRTVHVLRGDQLLETGLSLPEICRRFRIGTVLVEHPQSSALSATQATTLSALGASPEFHPLADTPFTRMGHPFQATAFRYTGPLADHMAEVPLSSHLL